MNQVKLIVLGVVAVLGLAALFSSIYQVAEQERAVLSTFSKFTTVEGPGLHFKLPFVQSVKTYKVDIQQLEGRGKKDDKGNDLGINTYTIDNQELNARYTVHYRIPVDQVERIFKQVPDYEIKLGNLAEDRFKVALGKLNITQVAERRGQVRDAIQETLSKDALNLFGLQIVDFQINNIDYTPKYRAEVETSALAKTQVDKEIQLRRSAEIAAERAKIAAEGQANAERERAQGEADAKLYVARAEAEAIRLKGLAEALAIESQAKALANNASLIELRRSERWNGVLPVNMFANAPLPMLNMDSYLKK